MKAISIHKTKDVLQVVILAVVALYFGRSFLVPLAFGILLAMLLLPVCRKLEQWGVGRVGAVFLCILLILLFLLGVLAVISTQIASFAQDWPQVQTKLNELLDTVQQWIQSQFGVAPQRQIAMLKKGISSLAQSGGSSFTKLFSGLLGSLTSFLLVLVYLFFLLWRREKYEEFFLQLSDQENQSETRQTLEQITKVSSEYLGGRLLSMLALAILYTIGFSVIGLKNAVLLGVIAVIPTIIPYVGPFIGGFFPLAMALVSGSSGMVLPVLVVLFAAQLLDNYLIEPFVLGSNLNLSPLITIISIVIGELVWGVAGMILFIPLFAIVEIVLDHLPRMQPYAFLLGDTEGEPKWMEKLKGWFQKAKDKM